MWGTPKTHGRSVPLPRFLVDELARAVVTRPADGLASAAVAHTPPDTRAAEERVAALEREKDSAVAVDAVATENA